MAQSSINNQQSTIGYIVGGGLKESFSGRLTIDPLTVQLNLVTKVEEEWLREMFPEDFTSGKRAQYDSINRRVVNVEEIRFRSLVLSMLKSPVRWGSVGTKATLDPCSGRFHNC